LSSSLRPPNGLFCFGLPTKTLCATIPSSICATWSVQLILLDLIIRPIFDEDIINLECFQ
jgi:hypothetical protein